MKSGSRQSSSKASLRGISKEHVMSQLEDLNPTPAQRKLIDRLYDRIFEHATGSRPTYTNPELDASRLERASRYEYKRFELRSSDSSSGSLSLITEIGLKGDEGTMAQVFARNRRHLWIGPRGGLSLLNSKDGVEYHGDAAVWKPTE